MKGKMNFHQPKADTVPIFKDIIKKIAPLGTLNLAISSDLTNEILFPRFCEDKIKVGEFLIEVLKKMPVSKDSLDLRWSILCSIGSLSQVYSLKTQLSKPQLKSNYLLRKVQNDFSSEMAFNDFSSLKDPITKQIIPYMSKAHNKINDKIAHNVSFYLVVLRDERPGIFYNLIPLLNDLFTNVRLDRIYKAINLEIISFFLINPTDFFATLDGQFCDEKDYPKLFSYPLIFSIPDFTHFLQTTLILERYPYPIPFYGNLNNSIYCSLLNSSIEKHQHILDLIAEIVMEAIINADIENVKKSTCMFPELLPYFLIVNQSLMYSELESFIELLETQYPPSPATNLIERFKNDFHLIQLMSMLTGTDVCSGDLLVNSIPYHLNTVLNKKTDDILVASKARYFSLSDKDAESDFDFIRSRAAFRQVIAIIDHTTPLQNLNESLDKMYNYINGMQNVVAKLDLIIDIFSLIFLTNKKDNSFVCTPYIAYKLVEKLVLFDPSDYINGAHEHFLKKKPKKSDQSLAPWFERDTSAIYKAIEKQEWETAEKLTIYLPNYKKIYTRAYDAYRYLHEGIEPWKNQDLIKLNVGLSHFGYREVLKSIEDQFPAYSSILEERIRSQDSINPIPTADKWNPVDEFSKMFDTSSLDMVKKIPDFLGTLTISKNLYKFLESVWIYYSCAKCGNYFHANTIEDLFVFDIYKALAGPVEVGEYQKAQQLANVANLKLIDFIFENLDHFDSFDEVFINKMFEKCPAATNALLLSLLHPTLFSKSKPTNDKFLDDEVNNEEFRRRYSEIVHKNEELNKVSQYLSLFDSAPQKEEKSKYDDDEDDSFANMIVLASEDPKRIDDLIFNVDHSEVYDYLVSTGNYSEEKLATTLYPIFRIVSYVAPESDQEKVERINVRHKVRQFSNARNTSEIIREIMVHQDFNLALRYLKTCVPSAETASPLCQLFTSSLSASEKSKLTLNSDNPAPLSSSPSFGSLTSLTFVDDILTAFPERFDVILSRFFHIPGIIKTLCKYAPEDKKVYMNGLSHLPELIFSDSNIFSIDTIVESYIRNFNYIFEITQEVANLFDDEKLFAMIKGVYEYMVSSYDMNLKSFNNLENISIFNNVCVHLYSFFDDKSILVNYWISYVEDTLQKFNLINSAKIEWNLNYYLQKLQNPLKLFQQNNSLEIIKAVSLLVSHFPFSRYGIAYSFNDYKLDSIEFGNEIVNICTKIDEDQLVKQLSKIFEINLDCYFLKKVKSQFNLYKYDDGRLTLRENSLKIDQYDQKVKLFDTTFSFLTPFNKLHLILQKDLSLASDPEKLRDENATFSIDVYANLKQKVSEMKKMQLHFQNYNFVDDKLMSMMFNVIKQYSRKDAAISMLISFKQFESAYIILMKEKDLEQRSNLFIHSFLVAIQFNNTNEYFKKFLYEKDPNLDQTFKLLNNAIDFFKKKSMHYNLDYVYTIRNQLDDASLMEVELFKDCQSFEKQVRLLGQIIYNLKTSLNYRKKPCSHSPPFITNMAISSNDLQILMEKSILQLNICSLWIERGIPFSHDLDIISSTEGATSVAAILYLNNSKELLADLQKLTKIPMKDVTSKVCEVLSHEPPNKVIEFWNNLKKHKASLGPNVPYELLRTLALSANQGIVYVIIMQFFTSDKEKCLLMLEYGYVVEAYALALSTGMKDLIPLIGKRAALIGDLNIYDNCVKLLSKRK